MKLIALPVLIAVVGCQHATGTISATQPAVGPPFPTTATQPLAVANSVPTHHLLAISGEFTNGGIVYLIDEDRELLSGFAFDSQLNRVVHMKPVDLRRVFRMASYPGQVENIHIAGNIQGDKYTVLTSRAAQGIDVLYVIDREGRIAVFAYDGKGQVFLRSIDSAMNAFKP